MAYLKWLIYTAPLEEAGGPTHLTFFNDWTDTFTSKEDMYSKRLLEALEIWYAKFPPSTKRDRSLPAPGARVSGGGALLDNPENYEPDRCAFAGPSAGDGAACSCPPEGCCRPRRGRGCSINNGCYKYIA